MQNLGLTLKIELFGNLVEQLSYWHDGYDEDGNEYCREEFEKTLKATQEMRDILLDELKEYIDGCKLAGIPIDLGYFRIKKQLEESSFRPR